MDSAEIDILRTHGFDDRAIHDATQVIGYFNYINRVADALGIEPETFIREWEVSLHQK
jgi:alkylhydroperoxidase family enzyme